MTLEKSKKKWDEEAENMKDFLLWELEDTGPAWERLLVRELKCTAPMKVLDAGCGTGFLTLLLARIGCEVIAIDSSKSMLTQAQLVADRLELSDKITFISQDMMLAEFMENTFEAIVSRYAFWLFEKPKEIYIEWKRILKPGGYMLNLDANWLFPLWGVKERAEFQADEDLLIKNFGKFKDCYHDNEMMSELKNLPLAYIQRPEWDIKICENVGFRDITTTFLDSKVYWNQFLAQRYKTMPTFMLKAKK